MYDSDLEVLTNALKVSQNKVESKGIKSVRSRVTNIRPYAKGQEPIGTFIKLFEQYMYKEFRMEKYELTDRDVAAVRKLSDEVYRRWEWNYGSSPAYSIVRANRIEGCGLIQANIKIGKSGIIEDISFSGDYFFMEEPKYLTERLCGCRFNSEAISDALSDFQVDRCFAGLSNEKFVELLLYSEAQRE
jgi:lipoate-protein ligase A